MRKRARAKVCVHAPWNMSTIYILESFTRFLAKRARSPSPCLLDVETVDAEDTTDEEIESGMLSTKRPLQKRAKPLFLAFDSDGTFNLYHCRLWGSPNI